MRSLPDLSAKSLQEKKMIAPTFSHEHRFSALHAGLASSTLTASVQQLTG